MRVSLLRRKNMENLIKKKKGYSIASAFRYEKNHSINLHFAKVKD